MLQMKDRKRRYCNYDKKRKAAFRRRGLQANSKTYQSIMNLTNQIIRQTGGNQKFFVRQEVKRGESNG